MSKGPIVWVEKEAHLVYAKFMHYALLPVLLIGSDILIGFWGHYTGSTDGQLSIESFIEYLQTTPLEHFFMVFIVALVVVAIVECIVRQHKKVPLRKK